MAACLHPGCPLGGAAGWSGATDVLAGEFKRLDSRRVEDLLGLASGLGVLAGPKTTADTGWGRGCWSWRHACRPTSPRTSAWRQSSTGRSWRGTAPPQGDPEVTSESAAEIYDMSGDPGARIHRWWPYWGRKLGNGGLVAEEICMQVLESKGLQRIRDTRTTPWGHRSPR